MKRVPVADTEDVAAKVRETFHDSKSRKKVRLGFEWPSEFAFVGRGHGVMYHSDKWNREDDYKHKRESKWWDVYVSDVIDISSARLPRGRAYEICDTMPKHVSYIGPFLGIQFVTLAGKTSHIEMEDAHWAAAKIPSTGETVLIAYAQDGICILVTGEQLDIEKDGIVG